MDKAERAVTGSFKNMATSALGYVTAFASVSSVVNGLKSSIDVLGKLDDMAQKTGSSVENLSKLQKVAVQFGQDFGSIDTALVKLSKGLAGIDDEGGKTAKALQAIGISQEFVKTNDPSQVFVQIAKNLQTYKDGAGKVALVTDLMGKAAADNLPYLNDLAENVDKFTGVTAEAAARAAKLQDDIGGLKVKFQELFDTLTIGIIPSLDAFISRLNQVAKFKSIFSSVGGIDVKDADKEIAIREAKLKSVVQQYNGLAKDTVANNINEAIFGDKKTLQEQIKIFTDEINALKEMKKAKDALVGSPNAASPSGGKKLDYVGSEAQSAIDAEKDKAAKLAQTKREQAADNAQKLKDLQLELNQEIGDSDRKAQEEDKKKYFANERAKAEFAIQQMDIFYTDKANKTERDYKLIFAKEKELAEQRKAFWESAENAAHQVFTNLSQSGTDAFKQIGRTIKTYVLDLLYQMTVKKWFISIAATASGTASASTGSSGGGMDNIFGTLKSAFSDGNSSVVSGIKSLGETLSAFGSTGTGMFKDLASSIGSFTSLNATMISKALPFAGSVLKLAQGDVKGALGSALGAALSFTPLGPVGGAIGAMIGGSLFGGKKQPPRTVTQLPDVSKAFTSQLGALFGGFGLSDAISSSASYKGRSGGSGYGTLSASVNGQSIGFNDRYKDAYGEKTMQEHINKVLTTGVINGIKASSLSTAVKSLFDNLASQESVTNMINASVALKGSEKQLASRFGLSVDQSVNLGKITGLKDNDLSVYLSQLGEISLAYKTDAEVMSEAKESLTKVFGQSLPASIDEFDKKIKETDKTTSEGLTKVAEMLNVRAGFITYQSAIESLNNTLVDSATALGLIDSNNYQDRASFETAQAFAGQGLRGIYNSSDASQNGTLLASELQKLRAGIAELVKYAQNTASSTQETSRLLMSVSDGASLITTAG